MSGFVNPTTVNVDDVNATNDVTAGNDVIAGNDVVATGNVSAAVALLGGGAVLADGLVNANSGVFGDGTSSDGITIFGSSFVRVAFIGVAATGDGGVVYDLTAKRFLFDIETLAKLELNADAIEPFTDALLSSGTAIRRWSNVHADALTIAGSGTFTGAVQMSGDLNHDGIGVGFYGTTPAAVSAVYTRTATVVESRTLAANASATAANNNAVLAAIIADLQSVGLFAT